MTMWIRLVFVFAVVLAAENGRLKFVIETFDIKSLTKDVFEVLNYSVSQINNRSYINGHIIFQRYYNVIEFESTLDLFRDHKEKMRLFRFKMDGCSYAKVTHKNLVQSLISRTFLKHTKGELGCPIIPVSLDKLQRDDGFQYINLSLQHYNYTIENWHLREEDLPSYIPEGAYQFLTTYILHKKRAVRVSTSFKLAF